MNALQASVLVQETCPPELPGIKLNSVKQLWDTPSSQSYCRETEKNAEKMMIFKVLHQKKPRGKVVIGSNDPIILIKIHE